MEDDKEHFEHLKKIICKWGADSEKRIDILRFEDAPSLLNNTEYFDLVFLDILLEGTNGMDAARALYSRGERAKMVFVSCTPEFVFQGYEVNAFRYILKPYEESEIERVLEQFAGTLNKNALWLKDGAETLKISYDEISYIEARGRRTVFAGDGMNLTVNIGITEAETLLPPDIFYRCQKSFIVNLEQITAFKRYEVTLKNGEVLPVSRAKWAELCEKMLRYLSK